MLHEDELQELLKKAEDIQAQIADYNDNLIDMDGDWLRRARHAHRVTIQEYRRKKAELVKERAASNFSRLLKAVRIVLRKFEGSPEFDELREAYGVFFKKHD